MSVPTNSERRKFQRTPVVRACKVRDRRTARYLPAQTADLSEGGALLRIERSRPIGPGDELDMYLGQDGVIVLAGSESVRATVRRVTPIDHHYQAIALEFGAAEATVEPARAVAA